MQNEMAFRVSAETRLRVVEALAMLLEGSGLVTNAGEAAEEALRTILVVSPAENMGTLSVPATVDLELALRLHRLASQSRSAAADLADFLDALKVEQDDRDAYGQVERLAQGAAAAWRTSKGLAEAADLAILRLDRKAREKRAAEAEAELLGVATFGSDR